MELSLKKLSFETLIYGFGNVFSRLITFLLLPLYTNLLNPKEYGIITLLYVFIGFMNIIYHYGLDSSFLKYFADQKNKENQKKIFSTAFFLNFLSSILFSILIIIFSHKLSLIIFNDEIYQNLFKISSYILFFDSISHIPFALLRIQKKAFIFMLIKFLNVSVTLFFNIYFLIIKGTGIEGVFNSILIASIISTLFVFFSSINSFKLVLKYDYIKKLINFGLPFLPAGIASITMESIDRYILSILTDTYTVGIYTVGYKLGIFMLIFSTAFNYAWQPFFLSINKDDIAKKLFSKIFTFYISLAFIIWVFISLFIKDIIDIQFLGYSLIESKYNESITIVPFILLSYIFQGAYYNFLPGIYFQEKTKIIPLIVSISASINIFTNILLIPIYGMVGSAIATLFGHLTMAILTYYKSKKLFYIKYEWIKLFVLFFISLTIIIISQIFIISIFIKIFICVLLIILLFQIKIFSFNS